MADDSDSWSMVDAEDEASKDRTPVTSSLHLSTIDALGKDFTSFLVHTECNSLSLQ